MRLRRMTFGLWCHANAGCQITLGRATSAAPPTTEGTALRPLLQSSLPLAVAALCGLAASSSAWAQAGAVQPGRVERDTRPLPEPIRRDSVRIDAPRFADQPPPGAQDVRFLLGEVQ